MKIQGDPDHPVTQGFLCYRTSRFLERQYDPDRITTPLLRRERRRSRAVGWDDALDLIAEKMLRIKSESGGEAILHYRSGGTLGVMKFLNDRLFELFGPCAVKTGDICSGAGDAAQLTDFGEEDSNDLFDLLNAKTIVLWGRTRTSATSTSFPSSSRRVRGGADRPHRPGAPPRRRPRAALRAAAARRRHRPGARDREAAVRDGEDRPDGRRLLRSPRRVPVAGVLAQRRRLGRARRRPARRARGASPISTETDRRRSSSGGDCSARRTGSATVRTARRAGRHQRKPRRSGRRRLVLLQAPRRVRHLVSGAARRRRAASLEPLLGRRDPRRRRPADPDGVGDGGQSGGDAPRVPHRQRRLRDAGADRRRRRVPDRHRARRARRAPDDDDARGRRSRRGVRPSLARRGPSRRARRPTA